MLIFNEKATSGPLKFSYVVEYVQAFDKLIVEHFKFLLETW